MHRIGAAVIVVIFLYLLIVTSSASVPPPTFSSSQRNVTAAFGTEVRLPCRVTDPSKTARHWWTRNGNEIKKSRKYRPKKFRYLRIKNVDRSDAGDYVCWAMNAGGKIQQTITLNVEGEVEGKLKPRGQPGKGRPWFVKAQPEQQFIAWPASRDLKLRCRADGEPPLKYQWLKDGKVLKYRRLDRKFNDTRWYLRIKTAVPSDNGLYKCIVSNRLGNISSHNIELTVAEKGPVRPILSAQYPLNKTARIGDNVTFQCIELFSPILTDYRWLHWKKLPPSYPDLEFDDNSPSMNSSYYTMINPRYYQPFQVHKEEGKYGGRVLLYNVTKEDEGMYTCLISNHLGLSWRSAFLRVFSSEVPFGKRPEFVPQSYVAEVNKTVRLKCAFTNWYASWRMIWHMHGKVIRPGMNTRFQIVIGKSSFLVIKDVQKGDAGIFECAASNAFGSVSKKMNLTVTG